MNHAKDNLAEQFKDSGLSYFAIANRVWRLRHWKPGLCTKCLREPVEDGYRYGNRCRAYAVGYAKKKKARKAAEKAGA